MTSLQTNQLIVGYNERAISQPLQIDVPRQKFNVILGKNGCGKSTVLKTIARIIPAVKGDVFLDGQSIANFSNKEFARKVTFLAQDTVVPEGLTVEDLVWFGRHPHQGLFLDKSQSEQEIVDDALALTGLTAMRSCEVARVSGGQRQKAFIAMALAQDAPVMLLDEPISFLDLHYQLELLRLFKQLTRDRGKTVVAVLHEINLTAQFADHVFVLNDGQIDSQGAVQDILTEELIDRVYAVKAKKFLHPQYNVPQFSYCL